MLKRLVAGFAGVILSATLASAQTDEIDRLLDLLELDAYLTIVAEEGVQDALGIEDEMFAGRGGSAWEALVADVYDPETIKSTFKTRFVAAMDGVDLAPIFAFYDTDQGARIITGELMARQGMRDEDVEAAAIVAYEDLVGEIDPRRALIDGFMDVNDLVERNVMGALNTNFAFLSGMAENDIFAARLTQSEIIARVYERENELRVDAREWLQAYYVLAFDGLANADIQAYIEHADSPSGKAFNRAVFEGFDAFFDQSSFRLGRAAADFISGQDL
ncbi:MAG: hypothetical protein AAFN59_06860 [Pseudomonadota bacterium]